MMINHKRLFRLYREEKFSVRKRGVRKRALGPRAPMLEQSHFSLNRIGIPKSGLM